MKTAALLLVALLASAPARGVDLRAKSTSASRQFVVFCEDVALRGRVAGFVEEVKRDVLGTLGQADRWRIPIVISLAAAPDPEAVAVPVTLRLVQTPDGPTVQLGVTIGDPAAVHLQKHIIRAVLLDFMYRDRPPQPGEVYVEPPWWIVSGIVEEVRRRDLGIQAAPFQQMLEAGKLPDVSGFLASAPLDSTGATFAAACAHALLHLLRDQPEGQARLATLLRDWPDAGEDFTGAITRAFPMLGADEAGLQKWWTLNVARFAASERYRGLSAPETDRELQQLLEFEVAVDKAGKTRRFPLGAYAEFIRLPGGKAAAARQQRAIIALSVRANSLLRPVLADYEVVFALLARGRTRGIAERIQRAEAYRASVLPRGEETTGYFKWFEGAPTADFQRPMTAHDAQMAAYRELFEDQRNQSAPPPPAIPARTPLPAVATPLPR